MSISKDDRLRVESAILCLAAGARALDAMDLDELADEIADAIDCLILVVGDKDIVLDNKHKQIIEYARKAGEKRG